VVQELLAVGFAEYSQFKANAGPFAQAESEGTSNNWYLVSMPPIDWYGGLMTRWRSVIQLRTESSEEARYERVVDGVHKGMKGWLRFTLIYASVAFVVWLALVIIINVFA